MTPSQIFWAVVTGIILFSTVVFLIVALFKMKRSIKWGIAFFSVLLAVSLIKLIGNLITSGKINIGIIMVAALVVISLIAFILMWRTRKKMGEAKKSVDEMNDKIDNLKRMVEEDENNNGDDNE